MADHMRTELVTDALQMALAHRRPDRGLIWHSDQGSQGDCFDNAVAESFFATLKKELIHRRSWPNKNELRTEVFDSIEVFYNRQRRHSTLGQLSPAAYEATTLSPPGSPLAGSRLASPSQNLSIQTHQKPKPPNQPLSTETGEPQTSRRDWPGAIAVRDETCVTPLEGCGGVATKDVKGRSGNEASRSRPPGATPLRAQGDGHLRPLDRVPSSVP